MNNHLIYLVFGKESLIYEAIYSIMSFYKYHDYKSVDKIHIFTDKMELFKTHLPEKNLVFHNLDTKKQQLWSGEYNYIYRLKIKCLLEVSNLYKGNFVFVDADTVFREKFDSIYSNIEKDILILNFNEGAIKTKKTREFKKYYKFLSKNKNVVFTETSSAKEALETEMWNSGVIGFNSKNSFLVERALTFCDALVARTSIRTIEQFAISYYFQQGKLIDADKEIFHYWYFKDFGNIVEQFLEINRENTFQKRIENMNCIDPENIAKEIIQYKNMSFFDKTFQKIRTGKKWKLQPYTIKN